MTLTVSNYVERTRLSYRIEKYLPNGKIVAGNVLNMKEWPEGIVITRLRYELRNSTTRGDQLFSA